MYISPNFNLEIIEKINSEGVNSALYLVKDIQLGSIFILKQIAKGNFKQANKYFEESTKIYNLKHPNIIPINTASYDENYIYITMPYFKRGSLYSLLQRGNLSVRQIIKYSLDFLSALDYMHSKGIIHCDIKPNNILIGDNNNAVLTDFGSALYLNRLGNARLKNVYYKHIAPEQCSNSIISKKIDIYQIGTTLYRMCNGNEEYDKQAKRYKDLNSLKLACAKGRFPIRKKYLPHIPKSMINIVEKCMKINPEERYKNVLEIMNDISLIDENLDWNYYKISKNSYSWMLGDIAKLDLYKDNDVWNIIDNGKINSFVDSKAKGYRVIREIIKKY